MSRYADRYGHDWTDLDRDEATERAYALGVAEKMDEPDRAELERIYTALHTSYARSLVEVAFREGRSEATRVERDADGDQLDPWHQLVEGETVLFDSPEGLTGGRDGLPEALDPTEFLDKLDVDSRDATHRPNFLDR